MENINFTRFKSGRTYGDQRSFSKESLVNLWLIENYFNSSVKCLALLDRHSFWTMLSLTSKVSGLAREVVNLTPRFREAFNREKRIRTAAISPGLDA